jgi:hypothetical protein
MLTLVAGEKSRAHNHHNALALTLFAHGRPILVGPGYPGYQDLQLRNVLIGTPSQTTVSVDGGSHRLGDTSLLFLQREFRDIPGGKIPAQVALQAESTLYEGVTHRRSLFYGPSPQSVLLIDELTSAEEHRYQQQFRIEENLHGRTERGRVTVFPAGDNPQPLLVIHNSLITDGAVGETQARMSGTVAGFPAYERNVVFLSLLDYSGSEDIANDALRITPDRVTWKGSLGELDLSLPVSPADVRWSVDMANAAH